MFFLIGVVILILFIVFIYFYIQYKIKHTFGVSFEEIIQSARLEDEEVPKSLSSMDSIYLEQIKKDFPDLNINELKRMAEKVVLDVFSSIESGDYQEIKNSTIKSLIKKKIHENKNAKYDQFQFHKTVISKYEKKKGIATIYFGSSFEYFYECNGERKKIQDRARIEFIYVFDTRNVSDSKRNFGLNCPNCGSPLVTLGDHKCSYCGTVVVDIVKKVWNCNDVVFY